MVIVTFPDGSTKEYEAGTTGLKIAEDISQGLAQNAVAMKLNDDVVDINTPVAEDAKVKILTTKDSEGMEVFRHSTAHLMAHAITELYPYAKLTIGPVVEEGFYYDMEHEAFKSEDLKKIERKMHEIMKQKQTMEKEEVTKEKALEIFKDNEYKTEMINDLEDETITIYRQGSFVDLCRGPHVPHTGMIKAFKLTKIAGAYWRGDSKNKQLQRIYGISFPTKDELKEYIKMREEAEKRDHNKLGRELGLFITSDIVGKGLPLFTPKGAIMKMMLRRFIEDEELKRGYQYTSTPVLAKSDLYKLSGHLDHYRESMFVFDVNGEEMVLRPMTCPHQFMIYKSQLRSYKDLPIRYAEVADLFRNEQSGELHGLIRIRQFSLADAHIICRPDQLDLEFEGVLDLVQYVMKTLGFDNYWYRFSKWDPNNKDKYIDNPEAWELSQNMMKEILDRLRLEYDEVDDEAAFYGPKLDVQMRNVYGKEDTIFTIQIDFALPEKFDMTYEGEDNKKHRPMVIHRSSIGCLERTLAMLIEKYAGKFPLWISPVQVKILAVSDKHNDYSAFIKEKLHNAGVRVELDDRAESIPKKVRNAQMQKINYILVVGDKEQENQTVNVRTRDNVVHGEKKIDDFLSEVLDEIRERR
ncbi:threonine--tRNA ligase [Candidatus Woesearchaeota archaeon]|nr:threonine--tRNA ligase [Candidatus Woesearchaeota archaeon]